MQCAKEHFTVLHSVMWLVVKLFGEPSICNLVVLCWFCLQKALLSVRTKAQMDVHTV